MTTEETLKAYAAFGSPDAIRAKLAELDKLKEQAAQTEKSARTAEAAEAAGFNPAVLAQISGDVDFEIRAVKKDGQTVTVPYAVITSGARKEALPLAEYAESHWQAFLPVLKAEEKGRAQKLVGSQPASAPTGTPFIRQIANVKPALPSPAEALLRKRYRPEAKKA